MMMKQFLAPALSMALVLALSACGSESGEIVETNTDTTAGTTTGSDGGNNNPTDGNDTAGTGTGGSGTDGSGTDGNADDGSTTAVVPSGSIEGVWFGDNNFGTGVMIVDASQNVYALTGSGSQYESVFGPASQELQRFLHRDSENAAFNDSFTIAGDLPSDISGNPADNVIVYNLQAENDGQQITNTVADTGFTMTFADENALPALTLADAVGSWTSKSSFCPMDCNITLSFNISASGDVTGSTVFNDFEPFTLEGTVSSATNASQYLSVSFEWLEQARTGVLYRDRNDTNRLILNTVGPNGDGTGSQSFTANMIRQ